MHRPEDFLSAELSLKHYRGEQLKQGGQGTVYKYICPHTGVTYAVKVMEYNHDILDEEGNPSNKIYMERESHVSPSFQHAHLLRAHAVFEYEEGFAIIMPYFQRGSLRQLKLNPIEIKDAIRQILEALRHLHERHKFHRDIKPDNVLVRSKEGEPLDLVVADYGLISPENPVSFVGTLRYTAPEIAQNRYMDKAKCRQYSEKVDIYALGMLLLDLLGVNMPIPLIAKPKDFKRHIGERLDDELDECDPEDFERHNALSTAKTMLRFDSKSRPSADECLRLPWLDGLPATPQPGQLARAPSKSSAIIPLADLSVDERDKTWWHSTPRAEAPAQQVQKSSTLSRRYPLRKRKYTEQYNPISAPQKSKVQKRSYKSLPTSRPTPKKIENAWKSEGAQPLEPFKSQNPRDIPLEVSLKTEEAIFEESNDLLSWDNSKMEL